MLDCPAADGGGDDAGGGDDDGGGVAGGDEEACSPGVLAFKALSDKRTWRAWSNEFRTC